MSPTCQSAVSAAVERGIESGCPRRPAQRGVRRRTLRAASGHRRYALDIRPTIDVSEAVCKPSSVPSRAEARDGDGHPSLAAGHPTAHAADPRAGQRTSPPSPVARRRVAPSYLALLRVEFARFTPNGGSRRRSASSLWHWSSPHGGRALPATLRCGARTFLTPPTGSPPSPTRDHPTASLTAGVYPAGDRALSSGSVAGRERT